MTITHHIDDATLMSYAAGALPSALTAVVAAHAAMCARCRTELAHHERVGAVMLDGLSPVALSGREPSGPTGATVMAPTGATVMAPTGTDGDLPQGLARLIGAPLDDVRWRPLAIGVWHRRLPLTGPSSGDLRLIKAGPGRGLPAHGHGGSELTLVLRGDYSDEVGAFRAGDVADLDEAVEHHPIAGGWGCICLIACEKPARFHGLLARLLAPWHGL